jgi:hypothetical protein
MRAPTTAGASATPVLEVKGLEKHFPVRTGLLRGLLGGLSP